MNKKEFEGKTAVVTGAGQGIGFEIGRQLANQGASVILNDIDAALYVRRRRNGVIAEGRDGTDGRNDRTSCVAIPGDSSDLATIERMVDAFVRNFGSLDIIIANAGITLFGNFLDYPAADFFSVMRVNLGGTFFFCAGRGPPDEGARHREVRWAIVHVPLLPATRPIRTWPPTA